MTCCRNEGVTETLPCVKPVPTDANSKSNQDDQTEVKEEPVDRSYEIDLNDKL